MISKEVFGRFVPVIFHVEQTVLRAGLSVPVVTMLVLLLAVFTA
jgi:hypothetical protein